MIVQHIQLDIVSHYFAYRVPLNVSNDLFQTLYVENRSRIYHYFKRCVKHKRTLSFGRLYIPLPAIKMTDMALFDGTRLEKVVVMFTLIAVYGKCCIFFNLSSM